MLLSTSRQVRLAVVTLLVIAAILMIAVIPFIGFDMVNPMVKAQQVRIEKFTAEGNPQAPLLALTVWLVSFFFPFWSTMSFIAGIVLLVIALPLYRGERWTRGLALLCLAIPSIGGAYMIVPWMNFVGGGFPPAVTMMTIGLIPYFAILLAEKVDLTKKWWTSWSSSCWVSLPQKTLPMDMQPIASYSDILLVHYLPKVLL